MNNYNLNDELIGLKVKEVTMCAFVDGDDNLELLKLSADCEQIELWKLYEGTVESVVTSVTISEDSYYVSPNRAILSLKLEGNDWNGVYAQFGDINYLRWNKEELKLSFIGTQDIDGCTATGSFVITFER